MSRLRQVDSFPWTLRSFTGVARLLYLTLCGFVLMALLEVTFPPVLAQGELVTVVLKPVADTTLYETSPDNNLGGTSNLPVGAMSSGKRSRALIKFDVAGAIPSNIAIESVELTINILNVAGSGPDTSLHLHRLLKSWGEGTKTGNAGGPASPLESTWNSRFHPDQKWSIPGGVTNADFAGVSSSMVQVPGTNAYTFPTTTDTVSDVNYWLRDPTNNFGWIIISDAEATPQSARRFSSREDTNNAPLLKIIYREINSDPIEKFEVNPPFARLHLNFAPNVIYVLDSRDSFEGGSAWKNVTNFPSSVTAQRYVFTDSLGANTRRFYRLGITNVTTVGPP